MECSSSITDGTDDRVALPLSSTLMQSDSPDSPPRPGRAGSRKRQSAVSIERIPEIYSGATFDSDNSHDDENDTRGADDHQRDGPLSPSQELYRDVFEIEAKLRDRETCETWVEYQMSLFEHVAYISSFAVFGTVVRVFAARLFGHDCEYKNTDEAVVDFMSPLSDLICITASGKTSATGGALFTDLPANILGSFLAGILTPPATGRNIAWFRKDHPLQHNKAFHTALKVGFCGSLTTFSSWNTQMVVMMDGTATVLGSQVPAALFGYMIGIMCSIASFFFGRHVYEWWISIHADSSELEREHILPCNSVPDVEQATSAHGDEATEHHSSRCIAKCTDCWTRFLSALALTITPFVVVALLVGAFVYGSKVEDIAFYGKMWLSVILAPFGAVLRWWLVKFNDSKGYWKSLEFIPWGTLTANLLACVISILAEALDTKHYVLGEPMMHTSSLVPALLLAIEAGFSGSLSTVSTFVAELVTMKSVTKSYIYGVATIVPAMIISLLLYSPIIRS